MCLLHKAPSKTCCLLSPGRSSEETGYYRWVIVKKKKKTYRCGYVQTPPLSGQCIHVNIPILGSESKIQTQTFTGSAPVNKLAINKVVHQD